ncbi:MAG TPA: nuclear transport factor 2 family protein [Rhodothermales bacterium]
MKNRTTAQVLDHHLKAMKVGVDEIMKDYDDDSVVMTPQGTFKGADALRNGFGALISSFPDGFWDSFTVFHTEVVGDFAFIVWTALPFVELGTDTLVVRKGIVVCQTTVSKVAG